MLSVILCEAETITKAVVDPLADLLGTWSKRNKRVERTASRSAVGCAVGDNRLRAFE